MGNGILGGGAPSHTKLSRERRLRMRELATRKLSKAYHLDEIVASVATMQSASSVVEVAKLVLERNENDIDAKYVDFFHEKIPSRMLAESTSLERLDDIIRTQPTDTAVLRTRAVTKVFKNDLTGAVADLTEALTHARSISTQYTAARGRTGLWTKLSSGRELSSSQSCRTDPNTPEDDQPSSLRAQLLFQRAGIYLSLACHSVTTYLTSSKSAAKLRVVSDPAELEVQPEGSHPPTIDHSQDWETRKLTKSYAKRALRDYVSYLDFFEYTTGARADPIDQREQGPSHASPSFELSPTDWNAKCPKGLHIRTLDKADPSRALIPYESEVACSRNGYSMSGSQYPSPSLKVYRISELFAAAPPTDLSPYPVASIEMIKLGSRTCPDHTSNVLPAAGQAEALTFHPLLIEALHSLLLCHSLVQTSTKEHLRHAHMVARLARICDGYPLFLASRSPSRSDWIEVLRRADNWIGLEHPWESLCAPAFLASEPKEQQKEETQEQARQRIRQEAIMESLADERVVDDETYQAAVTSRQRSAETLQGDFPAAERKGDGQDFPICSERAEAIAMWVREVSTDITGSGKSKRQGKKGGLVSKGKLSTAKTILYADT
ncbi:MAG: hypothetical protein L6R39_000134 [Caloplaca ligustica]|nr:MAG: hypothetical protein L6R39_000134 [Caloplaca ligustica]